MKLTLHEFLTLDGVVQGPGGPTEDPEGGFEHGGWSYPYGDDEFLATMTGWFGLVDAFLLGRKTYQIFSSYWPNITDPDEPIAAALNTLPKYVASTTLQSVDWANSSLLGADVVSEIRVLKERPGRELQVHGSSDLAQTLIAHDLVDEYRLLYFPVHLGSGKKLFGEHTKPASLRLLDTKTTPNGVVISRYEPAGDVRYGSYLDE